MCAHTHEHTGSGVFTVPGQGGWGTASFCRAPDTGIWVKDTRVMGGALTRSATQILLDVLFNDIKESCQIGRLDVIFLS